jgi:hypothetical protein
LLQGKLLPEKSDAQAWHDSIHGDFKTGPTAVIFVAAVELRHGSRGGPQMKLVLRPLKRARSCRLYRRFGSDRFLQLLFPPVHSWKPPSLQSQEAEKMAVRWLTSASHSMAGRRWAAFWIKGERGDRKGKSRSGPDQKPKFRRRLQFFAEEGQGFAEAETPGSFPPKSEAPMTRTKCTRDVLLDWLLQLRENASEPCLKLFSRISLGNLPGSRCLLIVEVTDSDTVKGLTETIPTVVLEKHQILRRSVDVKSPTTGNVMNDGIGRISPSLMKRVREALGLTENLCAIQARIGGAKGMWITANGEPDIGVAVEDWIEVYPKQEKWACNWADEDHRTLEVKAWATELKPATVNLQFLPILDDRSTNKQNTRSAIGQCLIDDLNGDLESMKAALKHPAQFRKWVHGLSFRHPERVRGVPFLGGLPDSDADALSFLVDGGFDPMRQKYLSDLVFKLQKDKCKKLETELKIKIERSTRAFMVVDFLGVLEPDEVHICFSKPFGMDRYSDLNGLDVLVARNPAHLPSDIQRVKAVFKPELRHLKDVIVFSMKGDVSLAHTLSGGDYDGDIAWVCWDSDIVGNFQNTETKPEDILPPEHVLSSLFDWNTTTVGELIPGYADRICVDKVVEQAFSFGLRHSLLGICTNYKEEFCRQRNCIGDEPSILLSWLLGELADEAKKGIIFTDIHWARFRTEMIGERSAYKNGVSGSGESQSHIVDHLRSVAESAVKKTLGKLDRFMFKDHAMSPDANYPYDADIAAYWNQFEDSFAASGRDSTSQPAWILSLRRGLTADLEACAGEWRILTSKNSDYRAGVLRVYERWRGIKPRNTDGYAQLEDFAPACLLQPAFLAPEISHWELLKASQTFKLYHYKLPKFTWRIAGHQLQFIKALGGASTARRRPSCYSGSNHASAACEELPVPVVPHVYGALRPHNKSIAQLTGGRGDELDWDDLDGDD